MSKKSKGKPKARDEDVFNANQARLDLLRLAEMLRKGVEMPEAYRVYWANLLERVAVGKEDANEALIHSSGVARQVSATRWKEVLTSVAAVGDERVQKQTDPDLANHIGVTSATVHAARQKYSAGVQQVLSANSASDRDALVGVAGHLTDKVKH